MRIVSFSHNDLDALVSQLCVDLKFKGQTDNYIEYFNTNYININEKVDEIEEYCHRNIVSLIVISDVSFSDNRGALLRLADIGLPVIFIDHHSYSEDFFGNLPTNITIFYDKTKCAAMICYETFKLENKNLKRLCEITNKFDIWQIQDKEFPIGFYLNSYFWSKKMEVHMKEFISRGYQLPSDFAQFCLHDKEAAHKHIDNLMSRNLIFTSNKITILFADDYWMHFLVDLFKDKENKCLLVVNSWGSIKVRFNSISEMKSEDKLRIKMELVGNDIGHENAFSYNTNKSFGTIMDEVKKIAELVERYGHL